MAILRLWQSGFELASPLEFSGYQSGPTFAGGVARSGSYALQLGSNIQIWVETATPITQARAGLHVRHQADAAGEFTVCALRSGVAVALRITYNGATSTWKAYAGATELKAAIDSDFAVASSYSQLGLDVKLAGAGGWVYLYRNGLPVLTFTGRTDYGTATCSRLYLGSPGVEPAPSALYVDDVYWESTVGESAPAAPPDVRFVPITPNANGSYSVWVGSDGNSADNYLLVDDAMNDGDATYVETGVSGQRDAYGMSTFVLEEGWLLNAVIGLALVRKLDANGALRAKLFTRLGGVNQDAAAVALGTDYGLLQVRQTNKPGGGAWDQVALDGIEIGLASE